MDFVLIILFPIAAAFLVNVFSLSFISSALLFFGLPSLYLSFKKPQIIKKSLLFTLILVGTFSWILGHMAFLDMSWYSDYSVLRFLNGTIPVEDIVFGFCWTYAGVTFWEYFLDHDKNKVRFSPNLRYFVTFLGVSLTVFVILYLNNSSWLHQEYFYLKLGLFVITPPIILVCFKFPKLIRKIVAIGLYFFFVSFVMEYSGLKLGHWWFPGKNFIAGVQVASKYLPFEEIMFWITLGIPGLICWYEIFADDRK